MEQVEQNKIRYIFEKYFGILYPIALALLIFVAFFKLGTGAIEDWDEARHGVNAYEMLKQNNYIVNFYNGEIDYWNLKPPLSYYSIMLGYKIFGFNTWGLRFFSAVWYVITALIVSLYLKNNVGKTESVISVLTFATCYTFFSFHYARSGDADSLFVLLYSIAFISLLKSDKEHRWLYLSGVAFALMFLTKSFHAFIMIPTVFFYFVFTKGFKRFRWWEISLFFIAALLPVIIYFAIRYFYDGFTFVRYMFEQDVVNRSANAIEQHNEPVFYYFYMIFANATEALMLVSAVADFIMMKMRKESFGNTEKLGIISLLSIFVIYTIAKTKLYWYIFPCVVPVCVCGAKAFCRLIRAIDRQKAKIITLAVTCLVFFGSGIASTYIVSSVRNRDNAQNLLYSIELKNDDVIYYEDEYTDEVRQSLLLVVELEFDAKCRDGGYDEFIKDEDGYLIVSKGSLEPSKKNKTVTVAENEEYIILKNDISD